MTLTSAERGERWRANQGDRLPGIKRAQRQSRSPAESAAARNGGICPHQLARL